MTQSRMKRRALLRARLFSEENRASKNTLLALF